MLCRRFSKLLGVREVLEWNQRAAWKWKCLSVRACVCLEWNALCREESAQLPTRLSPSADKLSRRRLQAAAPTAVRSLSPRFFVPGRPAADNFPSRPPHLSPPHPTPPSPSLRIRDGTRRHDPSSQRGVSRRGSEGLRLRKRSN